MGLHLYQQSNVNIAISISDCFDQYPNNTCRFSTDVDIVNILRTDYTHYHSLIDKKHNHIRNNYYPSLLQRLTYLLISSSVSSSIPSLPLSPFIHDKSRVVVASGIPVSSHRRGAHPSLPEEQSDVRVYPGFNHSRS